MKIPEHMEILDKTTYGFIFSTLGIKATEWLSLIDFNDILTIVFMCISVTLGLMKIYHQILLTKKLKDESNRHK